MRRRVAGALRRHRAFSAFNRLTERLGNSVTFAEYARELPGQFPAVSVAGPTWLAYARAFMLWFEYAGLITTAGQVAMLSDGENSAAPKMFGVRPPIRTRAVFPQRTPGPSVALLCRIATGNQIGPKLGGSEADALRQLLVLVAVEFRAGGSVQLVRPELICDGQVNAPCLRSLMEAKRGCKEALALLEEDGAAAPSIVGEVIRGAHGAEWTPQTVHWIGKNLRAWARLAGVKTLTRRPHRAVDTPDQQLDFSSLL